MTALAAPGAVTWIDVLKGGNYDPPNDNQAHAAGIDLVGDSSHAMLRAYRSGSGGSDSSTIYYFQALVGKNPGTVSFYLGSPSGRNPSDFSRILASAFDSLDSL